MMRFLTVLASITAIIALVVAPAIAQTQTQTPSPAPRPVPGAPSVEKSAPKEVEGTVKKVDSAARSVQVSSGLLGLFGATLEVTDQTRIRVEGKDGALADIREGAKVKASYENRNGKNVATSIDVMPAEDKDKPAPTTGAPARPAPPAGQPTPPAGQPKTQ